jgi:hypothetical protein
MNQTNDQKNVIDLVQLKDTFMGDLNVPRQCR